MSLLPADEEFEGEHVESLLAEQEALTAELEAGAGAPAPGGPPADDEVQSSLEAMQDGSDWGDDDAYPEHDYDESPAEGKPDSNDGIKSIIL